LDDQQKRSWKEQLVAILRDGFRWAERNVPPGLRTLVGLLLFVAGFFGFLPILGFWMTPLGAVLMAMDVPPLRRWVARKLGVDEHAGRV